MKMKKFLMFVMSILAITFLLAGCDDSYTPSPTKAPAVFEKQSKQNEANVKDLINKKELPKLDESLDFDNVKSRLEYLNQKNNVGYMYLLTGNGQLIREVQVMGKITSLNTYITPMEEVKKVESNFQGYNGAAYGGTYVTVQAPDLDGTYGENVNGVFWFTPDGVYQEWNGLYLFSAERLSFTTRPLLIEMGE